MAADACKLLCPFAKRWIFSPFGLNLRHSFNVEERNYLMYPILLL